MEIKQKALTEVQEVRMSVLACMETGNQDRARTLVWELLDVNEAAGNSLRMDVLSTYGVML